MNPIIVPLIIVAAVILWFLLTIIFKPLGAFLSKIWKDTKNTMSDDEEENKNNE